MKHKHNPWIYMVYNWDTPVGCFTSAAAACAMVRYISSRWEFPLPEGSVKVERYRTSYVLCELEREDITGMILRVVDKIRKEAVAAK